MKHQRISTYDDEITKNSENPSKSIHTFISYLLKERKSHLTLFILILVVISTIRSYPNGHFVEIDYGLAEGTNLTKGRGNAHMWKDSPYKKETLEIKNRYFKEIDSIDMSNVNGKQNLLIGVSIGTGEFQRRHLIRKLQIEPYKDFNVTFRFIMSRPAPWYVELLRDENKTHGDLIILENIEDSKDIATSIRPFEFFKYAEKNLQPYRFVAKMDSDTFLNIPDFERAYFNESFIQKDYAILSVMIKGQAKFDWLQGGFYAISWKILLFEARFYDNVLRTRYDEDIQVIWYLYDAKIPYTVLDIGDIRNYDFNYDTYPVFKHEVAEDAIRIHALKTDQDYINVASCFTTKGVNLTRVEELRLTNFT